MKQRIRYFDLAKGFLMILVVLHHIHMHGAKILGDLSVSVFLDYADDYWVMWYVVYACILYDYRYLQQL